jgi:hemerythrin
MHDLAYDPSLSTGFDDIDEQHRLFLDMLGELTARIEEGALRQGFLDALQGMRIYAAQHFSDEEALMATWAYPEYEAHCRLHETFRNMAGQLEKRAAAGPGLVSLEMLEFLGQWFIGHIRTEDLRFAAQAKARREAGKA